LFDVLKQILGFVNVGVLETECVDLLLCNAGVDVDDVVVDQTLEEVAEHADQAFLVFAVVHLLNVADAVCDLHVQELPGQVLAGGDQVVDHLHRVDVGGVAAERIDLDRTLGRAE